MKRIIISISILVLSLCFGIFVYKKLTYEKTYYDYTKFKQVPDLVDKNEKAIIFVKKDGCSPCKLVEPIVNDYAKNNKGTVFSIVGNKDKDYSSESKKYKIKGTPTLIFYRDGKEVQRTYGSFSETEFKKLVRKSEF